MSGLLTSPTFNVKNTPARTKKLKDFLEKHNLENSFNSATTYFDYVIENFAPKGITENTQENEEVNRLKNEVEKLKEENGKLIFAIRTNFVIYQEATDTSYTQMLDRASKVLKTALDENRIFKFEKEKNSLAVQTSTDLPLSIFDHPRLAEFKAFIKEEHKNAFDVLDFIKTEAQAALLETEKNAAFFNNAPLHFLDGEDYRRLLKWDEEVFLPAIKQMLTPELAEMYGIDDITKELTGADKFMMMWDLAAFDPAEKMLTLLPNLSPQQKEQLQDMSFPRNHVFIQVLQEIQQRKLKVTNEPTQPVQQENTATATENEGATVIKLNPTGVTDLTEDTGGGNGPE